MGLHTLQFWTDILILISSLTLPWGCCAPVFSPGPSLWAAPRQPLGRNAHRWSPRWGLASLRVGIGPGFFCRSAENSRELWWIVWCFSMFMLLQNASPVILGNPFPVLFSPTEPINTPMIHGLIQDSQVESENKRKRSRHAPKGQRAHSPGHRPGYDEAMKCALKGQKH